MAERIKPDPGSWGGELRIAREKLKLTRQQATADVEGVTAPMLARIENAKCSLEEYQKMRAHYEKLGASLPEMSPTVAAAIENEARPSGVPAPPQRRGGRRRTGNPLPWRERLHFVDGAVVDPTRCPRSIHTRRHWLWDEETKTATCRCGEDDAPPEPEVDDDDSIEDEEDELESAAT